MDDDFLPGKNVIQCKMRQEKSMCFFVLGQGEDSMMLVVFFLSFFLDSHFNFIPPMTQKNPPRFIPFTIDPQMEEETSGGLQHNNRKRR